MKLRQKIGYGLLYSTPVTGVVAGFVAVYKRSPQVAFEAALLLCGAVMLTLLVWLLIRE